MVSFLYKYFPGNINFNSFMGETSSLAGVMLSGFILLKVDSIWWLRICYTIAAIGSILMLVYVIRTDFYRSN